MIPKWMQGRDLNGDVLKVIPFEDASQEPITIADVENSTPEPWGPSWMLDGLAHLNTAKVVESTLDRITESVQEAERGSVIGPMNREVADVFTLDNPATKERYIFGDDAKVIEATLGEGYEEIDLNGLSSETLRAIPENYWPGRAFRLKEVK